MLKIRSCCPSSPMSSPLGPHLKMTNICFNSVSIPWSRLIGPKVSAMFSRRLRVIYAKNVSINLVVTQFLCCMTEPNYILALQSVEALATFFLPEEFLWCNDCHRKLLKGLKIVIFTSFQQQPFIYMYIRVLVILEQILIDF